MKLKLFYYSETSIAGKYPIHKQSIKDDMIDIVNHMPIQKFLKIKKYYLSKQRISIQSDDDELKLIYPFTNCKFI